MTPDPGSFPDWNSSGLLPPFVGTASSTSSRSPYPTNLSDLILRFGNTSDRIRLLHGLLDYRSALHNAGVQTGFQWIDGSFVEDTTGLDQRNPNDIDVVTFFHLPPRATQVNLVQTHPEIFDNITIKANYGVDAYHVVLNDGDHTHFYYLTRRIAYWNSLWSHSRKDQWKGYLELDLSTDDDAIAEALLQETAAREVQP